jgi:hypothetical protein
MQLGAARQLLAAEMSRRVKNLLAIAASYLAEDAQSTPVSVIELTRAVRIVGVLPKS